MKLSCIKSRARSRFTSPQSCRSRGDGGVWSPQILADQLTLSEPGKEQIMPTTLQLAPTPGFSDLPTASSRKKGTTVFF
jgi:hypothetical protein